MLSVFDFQNYREFLKAFYSEKKMSKRGFSYRNFARLCQFASPNFMKLVIEGKRNLSHEASEQIAEGLKLHKDESRFFIALVKFNQASTDEEKQKYYDELKDILPKQKRRILSEDSMIYLSHWLYPVLREMIEQKQFKEDPYWISRRLYGDVKPMQISQALNFLKESGFIFKNEKGKWACKDNFVISSDEIKSLGIRNYHRQMLELAKEMLEKVEMSKREYGALTLSLADEDLAEFKDKLKNFRQSIHEWAVNKLKNKNPSPEKDNLVVQLNFQMFPHLKKMETT